MKQFTNKKFSTLSVFVLMLSIFLFQCRKNEDVTINEPYQPVYISGGVFGNVVNNNGVPEPNVKVSNGNNSVMTDENGVFILKNQLLDKAGAQIKFEKAGFFTIYKSVIPIKDKMVFTKLQLVPKKLSKVINAVTGDVIVVNGNAQLTISSNSIADASGNLYNGQVQVYGYWMDPSVENTNYEMPGNLTGRDKDGKEVCLQTLGMLAVELEDLAGNPLNIATGKTAELKFPIPSSLDAQANSIIPLWYYNATKGGWIEEGNANREGNFYVGQVQHFSFWNCDYPYPLVNISGRILDNAGKPVGNILLEIKDLATNAIGNGWTTSDGNFAGKVPASSAFEMTVHADPCQTIFNKQFNTTTLDLDLGDINTNIKSLRIFGSIVDCSSNPVTNGYLQVWVNVKPFSVYLPVSATGVFDGNITACANFDLNYRAIDFNNLKQSSDITQNVGNLQDLDLGDIAACKDIEDIIVFNAKGVKTTYINGVHSFDIDHWFYAEGGGRDSSYINFRLNSADVTNPQKPLTFEVAGPLGSFYYLYDNSSTLTVKLNQYGPIGTQVKGTFNGTLYSLIAGDYIDVNGDFSVRRRN
jgi:hypothetical protein